MSDNLKALMQSALADYEAAGVSGSEGARAMREGLSHIEELEAKYPQNWATAQEYYKKRAEKAEAKNAELEAKISTWDRILRGSVPEEHKGCTSPVGSVQSYIAELEAKLMLAVEAIQEESANISIIAAGLEPRRQAEIENGATPTTVGERVWVSGMRLRQALAAIKGEDNDA
jgi:hypothetical protein